MDLLIVTAYHVMVAPKSLQMVFAVDVQVVVIYVMEQSVLPVHLDFCFIKVIA